MRKVGHQHANHIFGIIRDPFGINFPSSSSSSIDICEIPFNTKKSIKKEVKDCYHVANT